MIRDAVWIASSSRCPVSDQKNQHHDEDCEQHGDDEEIAKDLDR